MARRDAVGVTGRAALALFVAPGPGATAADVVAELRKLSPDGWIGERNGGDLPKRDPDTGRPLPLLPCPFTAVLLTYIEPSTHTVCPEPFDCLPRQALRTGFSAVRRSRGTSDAAQRVSTSAPWAEVHPERPPWQAVEGLDTNGFGIVSRLHSNGFGVAFPIDMNGFCGATSVLMPGTEHIIQPGKGSILVTMLTRRRPELDRAAYFTRWRNEHAPFGLRIGAAGYRQLHAHGNASGFDGAGMVFFDDLDHARRARAAPEVAEDATRDEMRFIDHSASMLAMFRRV